MAQARLSMRKIEEILRLKYELGLTHREIACSCAVSASTVSECVSHAKAAGISWPLPEGLGGAELEALLYPPSAAGHKHQIPEPDWQYVHKERRRKHVTLSFLWMEYRREHPGGYGYSQFCHHYKQWRAQLEPMMRQKHRAGEKLFVDYAGQTVTITDPETGAISQAQIFVAVLGASNYTYVESHADQSLPNWIGAHVRALDFLGGVPEVVVPDNLKAGVKRPDLYEPDINPTYQEFARYYGLAVVPTRVRKPKDKAKVEVGVQVAERWILAQLRDRTFFSLAELNQAVRQLVSDLNDRSIKHLAQSRHELFVELDQPALRPLPRPSYTYAHWKKARVHIDYHVQYDKHYYSVPYKLIGKEVDIRATEKTVEIYYRRQRQASHIRSDAPGRHSTQQDHMPPAHQVVAGWSAERFERWAEEIGPQTNAFITLLLNSRRHPQQAYRSCLGILGLAKQYGHERLEAACAWALTAGIHSYRGVNNILKHNMDRLERDEPAAAPLPAHANIRGQGYYS
jgi:transposase